MIPNVLTNLLMFILLVHMQHVISAAAATAEASSADQQQMSSPFRSSLSYMKSKQINCGQIEIEDEFVDLSLLSKKTTKTEEEEEDSSIDDELILVSNLTSCLYSSNEHNYTSFATHLASQLSRQLFDRYFHLDETNGLVYLRKKIDREILCKQVERATTTMSTGGSSLMDHQQPPVVLNYLSKYRKFTGTGRRLKRDDDQQSKSAGKSSHPFLLLANRQSLLMAGGGGGSSGDSIACDCKSEKCELRFKFIAFKSLPYHNPNQQHQQHGHRRSHLKQRRRLQTSNGQNSQIYKYLSLTVQVKDQNDNRPRFQKNFLNLNVSEHTQSASRTVSGGAASSDYDTVFAANKLNLGTLKQEKYECNMAKTYLNSHGGSSSSSGGPNAHSHHNHHQYQHNHQLNNLILIDKAVDRDVGKNAQTAYKLVLLDTRFEQLEISVLTN
jgi:hypothetical protein